MLASHAGRIRGRVRRELQVLLGVHSLDSAVWVLSVSLEIFSVSDSHGAPMCVAVRPCRAASYYRVIPSVAGVRCPASRFSANTPEVRRAGDSRGATYAYGGTHSWLDVGLQMLFRAGWRQEWLQTHAANVRRALFPDSLEATFAP